MKEKNKKHPICTVVRTAGQELDMAFIVEANTYHDLIYGLSRAINNAFEEERLEKEHEGDSNE